MYFYEARLAYASDRLEDALESMAQHFTQTVPAKVVEEAKAKGKTMRLNAITHEEVDVLSKIFKRKLKHDKKSINKLSVVEARLKSLRPYDEDTMR